MVRKNAFGLYLLTAGTALGLALSSAAYAGGGASLEERIAPVGKVNVAGAKAAPAAAPAAAAPAAAAPAAPAAPRDGETVYNSACMACHTTGAAGAPMLGNKDAWAPRIAQGTEVLVKHAVEGFTGQAGVMPPRGTCAACTDAELKNAVEYMVSKAQ